MRAQYNGAYLTCSVYSMQHVITGCQNVTINGKQLSDEEQFLNATYASIFARGNKRNSVSFEITRTFSNAGDALSWAAAEFDNQPTNGTLILEEDDGEGNVDQATMLYAVLANAGPVGVENGFLGITVTYRYQFEGGQITAATIPSPEPPVPTGEMRFTTSQFYAGELTDETLFGGFKFDRATYVTYVSLICDDAPTGANLTVCIVDASDVEQAGTTATLTAGSTFEQTTITELTLTASTRYRLKIKSVGSTNPGQNLTVTLHCRQ